MLYNKILHEGWGRVANTVQGKAECCICHETPPRVLYFIVQHKYMVLLLICWFCVGGLITSAWTWVWDNGFTKILNKLTEPVISPFVLPNQLKINDAQVLWHTNWFSAMPLGLCVWLPLVKYFYCNQEKGLSLLLKKRIRKTKEHALHDSTNFVDSRYYTSS